MYLSFFNNKLAFLESTAYVVYFLKEQDFLCTYKRSVYAVLITLIYVSVYIYL